MVLLKRDGISQDLNEKKYNLGGRLLLAEGRTGGKAPRKELAQLAQGTGRRPV